MNETLSKATVAAWTLALAFSILPVDGAASVLSFVAEPSAGDTSPAAISDGYAMKIVGMAFAGFLSPPKEGLGGVLTRTGRFLHVKTAFYPPVEDSPFSKARPINVWIDSSTGEIVDAPGHPVEKIADGEMRALLVASCKTMANLGDFGFETRYVGEFAFVSVDTGMPVVKHNPSADLMRPVPGGILVPVDGLWYEWPGLLWPCKAIVDPVARSVVCWQTDQLDAPPEARPEFCPAIPDSVVLSNAVAALHANALDWSQAYYRIVRTGENPVAEVHWFVTDNGIMTCRQERTSVEVDGKTGMAISVVLPDGEAGMLPWEGSLPQGDGQIGDEEAVRIAAKRLHSRENPGDCLIVVERTPDTVVVGFPNRKVHGGSFDFSPVVTLDATTGEVLSSVHH